MHLRGPLTRVLRLDSFPGLCGSGWPDSFPWPLTHAIRHQSRWRSTTPTPAPRTANTQVHIPLPQHGHRFVMQAGSVNKAGSLDRSKCLWNSHVRSLRSGLYGVASSIHERGVRTIAFNTGGSMGVTISVEERFRVGDRVGLPLGEDWGLVGTVTKRTNAAIYFTPQMRYLVEFDRVPNDLGRQLMRFYCDCLSCDRFYRKVRKAQARGNDTDDLVVEKMERCESPGARADGSLALWLGKWKIVNQTGKRRLPRFTY